MWDPVSIFFVWFYTQNTPLARISVEDVIRTKEISIIVDQINKDLKLRDGI